MMSTVKSELPTLALWFGSWRPRTHRGFPLAFRLAAHTLALCFLPSRSYDWLGVEIPPDFLNDLVAWLEQVWPISCEKLQDTALTGGNNEDRWLVLAQQERGSKAAAQLRRHVRVASGVGMIL